MIHQQHVDLIKNAIPKTVGVWADLGSGTGAFTLATADLLPSGSKIYSIDQNSLSLQSQEAEFSRLFPDFPISFHTADFTHLPGPLTSSSLSSKSSSLRVEDLTLSPKGRGNVGGLNGILMANSLHFVKDKVPVLKKLKELLKPGGRIVFVEYNVDQGNHWVPYPFSFETLKELAKEVGFNEPILAGTVPSQFLNAMYCAWITF